MMDSNTSSFMLPPQASTLAPGYDQIYWAVTYLCLFCFVLIMGAMTYFVVKYRYRGPGHKAAVISHNTAMEVAWSVVPLIVVMILFAWGFKNYLDMVIAPRNAIEIRVTGQKWQWSFEYENGATSTKEFAVPKGKPVKLIMTSRDVLHSFFVPAFRTKMDVIPNRYTTLWFEATQLSRPLIPSEGGFQVFCTEYCGKEHSDMLAKVFVLEPEHYEKWLQEHMGDPNAPPDQRGKRVFEQKGCPSCHAVKAAAEQAQPITGPRLFQVFGRTEKLTDGSSITVDENYVRESIENPAAKIVATFPSGVMPTFKGQISDKEMGDLITYIKSLK